MGGTTTGITALWFWRLQVCNQGTGRASLSETSREGSFLTRPASPWHSLACGGIIVVSASAFHGSSLWVSACDFFSGRVCVQSSLLDTYHPGLDPTPVTSSEHLKLIISAPSTFVRWQGLGCHFGGHTSACALSTQGSCGYLTTLLAAGVLFLEAMLLLSRATCPAEPRQSSRPREPH